MSKTKHDFITDFLFGVNGQFHQPDYDMLDSFYDLMQKEYEEKLRWIPVKEQLPKENGRYLAKSYNGYINILSFKSNMWSIMGYQSDITHWLPLSFL